MRVQQTVEQELDKKKDCTKKDVCLINGRLGFGQKNGQKQKSLHPSQL